MDIVAPQSSIPASSFLLYFFLLINFLTGFLLMQKCSLQTHPRPSLPSHEVEELVIPQPCDYLT